MEKQISPKVIALSFGVLILLFLAVFYILAWTEPTAAPPGGNVAAPINVSGDSQIKSGSLQVNGFRNVGNTILDGNVSIGGVAYMTGFQLGTSTTAGYVLTANASGVGTWQVAGGAAHNLLSATHSDTLAGAVARGDIIIGNSTPKWSKLAVGGAGSYLRSNGTDPSWSSIADADIPTTIVRTSRSISTTSPLLGGGDLSANRTLSLAGLSTLGGANQLVGVNSGPSAWEYKTLNGTTNQITVTNAAGSITLSAPQDIHTSASPTFNGLTLTGNLTVGGKLYFGLEAKTSNTTISAGSAGTVFADCSTGKIVLSGGCAWDSLFANVVMIGSVPSGNTSWLCAGRNDGPVSHILYVYAICARVEPW